MSSSMHDAPVNVLVVEDDEVDVEFLQRLFKKRGISNPIYHARNGVDGLALIRGENNREKVSKPFIVLLDINMPMMNGMEMLEELRKDEKLRDSIVFILTTSPREEDKQNAFKLNVAGYFLKQDVNELIELLGLYWKLNEFPEADSFTALNPYRSDLR
ncbi:MAG TPA: response regulator [Alphaproteobacteria bacterium]